MSSNSVTNYVDKLCFRVGSPGLAAGCTSSPTSWSSGNAFSGAEDLRFKSRVGQIRHSVANGSPPLQIFFLKELCCLLAQWRGDEPHQ